MRRLFWRIVVLFWVTAIMSLFAVASVITYQFEGQKITGYTTTPLDIATENHLHSAAFHLSQNGVLGLRKWLEQANGFGPLSIYVIDSQLRSLSDQEIPNDIIQAINHEVPLNKRLHINTLTGPDGAQYKIAIRFDGGAIGRLMHRPSLTLYVQTTVVIFLSAIVGLLLAFYIASPLARIRNIARRFAQGDLDARVGALPFGRSEEVVSLANEFDRMAERLKMLIESHRRLVHDVSHELRSPLARTKVALDLARGGTYEQMKESFQRIDLEADRLEAMLAQTLELSRLETAPLAQNEVIELDLLLEDIIINACYEGAPKNRRVEFIERIALTLQGEHAALYSAIENVIRNALTYTAEGTCVEVRLTYDHNDPQQAVITIKDYGPGIANETDLTRIFDAFYRTDIARTRKNGGTGLGLAIARRAIERHHGRINAHNASNGGLEVVITLPVNTLHQL